MSKIGVKLRELRRRRDLGVRELAIRSGVSHSSISLIERDKISPSVDTLSAILDALGTTLVGFFSEVQTMTAYSPFYKADDFVEIGRIGRVSYRMLGINHPNRELLMLHETYAPGSESGDAFSHSAQEAGVVIKGAIELTVGDDVQVLMPGDGYYFDSRRPHRFRNVDKGESQIISAVTPPTY
ncbi:cupin domain-containing protein [Bordetella sp. 2513F-2]